MLLKVAGDAVELEGTHRVILHLAQAHESFEQEARHLALRLPDGQACGAVLERVESGSDEITLDPYLRAFLHLQAGSSVHVEPAEFPAAVSFEVTLPDAAKYEGLKCLIRDSLVGKPLAEGQTVPVYTASLTGEQQLGTITATTPVGIVIAGRNTSLGLKSGSVTKVGVSYDSIGGLRKEIDRIREVVELPFKHPQVFQGLGITPPRGIILYGPPGTGKTLISRALAHEVGAAVLAIQGPEIISGWYGGSEQNLRQVFEEARAKAPAIIVIDEIDSIAPRRGGSVGEVERRVVATLLTLMDGLSELKEVVVIGTTNSINEIDPALRRPGRFEHEIHIGVPDAAGRKEILQIHARRMPLADDIAFGTVADQCHGYVGADLAALCRQAAYTALRRVHQDVHGLQEFDAIGDLLVTSDDFQNAISQVKPSAMREVLVEIPRDIGWEDIGGAAKIKQLLMENVVYGIQRREAFLAAGIKPAQGVLLYGEPGTGKTLLAKIVAKECSANLIAVRGPEIRSKWFGESEEKVRFIFNKAREVAPCVILFDELDAVGGARGAEAGDRKLTDSIVNQLLAEMDGLQNNENIFVIATTNRLKLIDNALLRPGRFSYQIYVPLPDPKEREQIFEVHLRGTLDASHIPISELSEKSDGLSGADIAEICRLAALETLRANDFRSEGLKLEMPLFDKAISEIRSNQHRLKDVGLV